MARSALAVALVGVLISLLTIAESIALSGVLLRAAVQAPSRSRRREAESGIDFDALGNLPKVEAVYSELNDYCTPIVAIRYVENVEGGRNNATLQGILLAYGSINVTSSQRMFPFRSNLVKYAGLQTYIELPAPGVSSYSSSSSSSSSSRQSVLITGGIGDTRDLMRGIMQTSLNHTFEYETSASGKYLAEALGRTIQMATMSSDDEPRKAHVLIASTAPEHPITLHSVDPGGNVAEVVAGMAGRGMRAGVEELQRRYRADISLSEARELAARLINPHLYANGEEEEKVGRDGGDGEKKERAEHEEEEQEEEKEEGEEGRAGARDYKKATLSVTFVVL